MYLNECNFAAAPTHIDETAFTFFNSFYYFALRIDYIWIIPCYKPIN